jgi:predicted nucleic acid-binding protein
MILLDTNILLRLTNRNHLSYKATHAAIVGCRKNHRQLSIVDQNLHEFWASATRPVNKNGMGMSPSRADRYLARFLGIFVRLGDPPDLLIQWRNLVNTHAISGAKSYDARLAAVAISLKLSGFMTYNVKDFTPFPITLVNPADPATW